MTDPFEVLHLPVGHTDPSPEYVARLDAHLRSRLAQLPGSRAAADDPPDDPKEAPMVTVDRAPAPPRSHRRLAIGAALAAAAAIIVAIVSILAARTGPDEVDIIDTPTTSTTGEGGTTTTVEPSTTSAAPTATTSPGTADASLPRIEDADTAGAAAFSGPSFAQSLAVHDGVVWLTATAGRTQRYDATTGARLGEVALDNASHATNPVFAFDAMWTARGSTDTLYRVDTASGAVTGSVVLPLDVQDIMSISASPVTASDDALWVVGLTERGNAAQVARVDPNSLTVTATIPAPRLAYNVIAGFGSLWVTTPSAIERLDPSSGAVQATIPLEARGMIYALALRAGPDSMWAHVRVDRADQVIRIDPTSNTISAAITTGNAVDGSWLEADIAFTDGAVWTCSNDAALVRIDPATNTVTRRVQTTKTGCAIGAGNDEIWFIGWTSKDLHRLPIG